MANYLISYHPLCSTKFGQKVAILEHKLAPFLDHSCRGEPDFSSRYPSITSLCRKALFAPKLEVGDRIVYMSIRKPCGQYNNIKERDYGHPKSNSLVAVLEVIDVLSSHQKGKNWYNNKKLAVPTNCMASPLPLAHDQTGGHFDEKGCGVHGVTIDDFNSCSKKAQQECGQNIVESMDAEYSKRAKQYPCFVITKWLSGNTQNPLALTNPDWGRIRCDGLHEVYNTQWPVKLCNAEFNRLHTISQSHTQSHP